MSGGRAFSMKLQEEDLFGRYFRFERVDGSHIASPLRLAVDHRIIGSNHPHETSWQIRNGLLTFHDDRGELITEFFQVSNAGGLLTLVGGFVPRDRKEPWHVLREIGT